MDFTSWAVVGVMSIVGIGAWFIGSVGGYHAGYKNGKYEGNARHAEDEK